MIPFLGILCWEIFSGGRTPYPTFSNHQVVDEVSKKVSCCKFRLNDQNCREIDRFFIVSFLYSEFPKCLTLDNKG